jgi:hypothetical protein
MRHLTFIPRVSCSAIALALSVSACSYSYDCGTLRQTTATGTVQDAGGETLATARADLTDNLRPTFLRLGVGVTGIDGAGPLRGHVTAARFVTEDGELLAEIPTSIATIHPNGVVALNMDVSSSTEYERVRSALLTGHAKVILETDLPGREHLEAELTDVIDGPGQISRCSPA